MHNLHLVRVRADSAKEAMIKAEEGLLGWGDENNWRTACGAVSENDEVHSEPLGISSRFPPDHLGLTSIEKINERCTVWANSPPYGVKGFKAIKRAKFKDLMDNVNTDRFNLWEAKKFLEFLYNTKDVRGRGTVNCLKDEIYPWVFDERGLTSIEDGDTQTRWIVFIDMHS